MRRNCYPRYRAVTAEARLDKERLQIKPAVSIFYLGNLCLRGHDHDGTGQSLRYKKGHCCKECNKEASKQHSRKARIAAAPRLPAECEICGIEPAKNEQQLCFDHHHETGAFRGWLCWGCNTALGKFGDNLDGLRKAIAYLERSVSNCYRAGCKETKANE